MGWRENDCKNQAIWIDARAISTAQIEHGPHSAFVSLCMIPPPEATTNVGVEKAPLLKKLSRPKNRKMYRKIENVVFRDASAILFLRVLQKRIFQQPRLFTLTIAQTRAGFGVNADHHCGRETSLQLEAGYIYADYTFAQSISSCTRAADHTSTPVIKDHLSQAGSRGISEKGLDLSAERPLFACQQESHAALSRYGSFSARPMAHRRNKPAGIGRKRVPRDRPLGCQPLVATGAVQRSQHRSERMAAIRCYIGASRASRSRLFSAERPGRG
jgi:hypothetical protein